MSNAADLAKFGSGISGGILQVQYTQFDTTSIISCGSNTDTEISSLAVNITPVSTNSIIKIEAMVNGEWADAASIYNSVWFFYRDSTKLSASAASSRNVGILMHSSRSYTSADASSTPESAVYSYFDTPSTTSQVTYKVGVNQSLGSAVNWYLNRCVADADIADQERGMSLICVTEIQA
tara:strand:- start:3674 stop:4210 length:537 start_codon:yes stop_codon:yes gene_type:complete